MDVISQGQAPRPEAAPALRGGPLRRVGQALLAAQEKADLSYAEKRALKRDEARPAHDRASRRLRQAEQELATARYRYEQVCGEFMLEEAGELDVAALEGEIAALEREVRRCQAAMRELERRLPAMIRDSFGTVLR